MAPLTRSSTELVDEAYSLYSNKENRGTMFVVPIKKLGTVCRNTAFKHWFQPVQRLSNPGQKANTHAITQIPWKMLTAAR